MSAADELPIPVFTQLTLKDAQPVAAPARQSAQDKLYLPMPADEVEQEIALLNQHIDYERAKIADLGLQLKNLQREYRKQTQALQRQSSAIHQHLDKLLALRKNMYDRRRRHRRHYGPEHQETLPEHQS